MRLTTLKDLRAEYKKANANNQEMFLVEGSQMLTSYAKYMIQYLEMKKIPSDMKLEFTPK